MSSLKLERILTASTAVLSTFLSSLLHHSVQPRSIGSTTYSFRVAEHDEGRLYVRHSRIRVSTNIEAYNANQVCSLFLGLSTSEVYNLLDGLRTVLGVHISLMGGPDSYTQTGHHIHDR